MTELEALQPAQQGDTIDGAALREVMGHILAVADAVEAILSENCSFAERRQILRRKRSLLGLAAVIGTASIPLQPGKPKVTAAQIEAAAAYAVSAISSVSSYRETLTYVDVLLDFFATVLSGDGERMLHEAVRLKQGPSANAPLFRDGVAPARPWEAAPYVLMPMRGGLRSPVMSTLETGRTGSATNTLALAGAPDAAAEGAPAVPHGQVLHSINGDGPKLAVLTRNDVLALKVSAPGVRVMPLVIYEVSRRPLLELEQYLATSDTALAVKLQVKVVQAGGPGAGQPVPGARVIAFTRFAQREGDMGVSDANGDVSLKLGGASRQLEVLVVYGPHGYWGLYRKDLLLESGATLEVPAVDLEVPDYLAQAAVGDKPLDAGTGVTVGVIDTGVDLSHPDLSVAGGAAFVVDENDEGGPGPAAEEGEHGSHVAGIIASHGAAPTGKRGVAPGVKLMSYRVFPNAGGGASNYDIIRAIDRSVADGCDLLNLSLGGPTRDEAVREAIKSAFDHGTLCIVAAGNDSRSPVSYPAKWPESVAVSALGKTGTFPAGSTEEVDAVAPFSTEDSSVFVAGFSNVGAEIDLTGPGVGIVSTVPGGTYAVMSGTSMACPTVTGAAAALLAQRTDILQMPRDSQRSIAILGLINGAARSMGFDKEYQGLGALP
jgi:subtilisin